MAPDVVGDSPAPCLLAVFGHPDDEIANAGGTIARYAAQGIRVVVVTATRGELGRIVAPDLDTAANRARLGELRMEELDRALARLAVTDGRWLGYRDSGVAGQPSNDDPDAFWRCDTGEAVGRLVRIIRETCPSVVITHDIGGDGGHPDHLRAGEITRLAFDLAGDPSGDGDRSGNLDAHAPWTPLKLYETAAQFDRRAKLRRLLAEEGIVGTVPVVLRAITRWRPSRERERAHAAALQHADGPIVRVDVVPWLDARHAALLEFRSQLAPSDELLALSPDDRRRIMPTENFSRRASRVPATDPETDLFAGLPLSG